MIPEKFLTRMEKMLPQAEFAAFCASLESEPVRGFRVNPVKTDAKSLLPLLPFLCEPLGFLENAFYAGSDKVGGLPAHHAGMFYMQDPSAISTVAAVEGLSGLKVIDLCAAPGGKSTQIGAAVGENGLLLSNEYVASRCRILQGNIERMGLTNTAVTNLSVKALADFYGSYFDLAVVDAPCSGEGMFRKYDNAAGEWSEENVLACAARQKEILADACRLVAPGGRLLYSTCTFSLEENEENVVWLLENYPDFRLVPVAKEVAEVTEPGIPVSEKYAGELQLCRRFYPHRSKGEGQFLALLQREDNGKENNPKNEIPALKKEKIEPVGVLFSDLLTKKPQGELRALREELYLCPPLPLPSYGVFTAGVCIGTLQKGRIEPHHQFYSAFGKLFKRQLQLSKDDPRVLAYLRGEEIACPELSSNGYTAVLYEGAPLGGGKAVDGRLKNHYPKGLRLRN